MRIVVLLLALNVLLASCQSTKESKVTIDEFSDDVDISLQYPQDCGAQSLQVDNSILGGGRSLQYGTKAVSNNYFVVCAEDVSCAFTSTISDGEWTTTITSDDVSGDCQLSATYAGDYIYYGINAGDGFRLTTDGADSFRVVATVTGNSAEIYINVGLETVTIINAPVGTNEFIIPFAYEDYYGYYYDLVFEITLGVRFTNTGSVSIKTFETYGPSNDNSAIRLPDQAPTSGVVSKFVLDDFSTGVEGTGTIVDIPPNEKCGGSSVGTQPFTGNIGLRDISFGACNKDGGSLQFQEVGGVFEASTSTGVVGRLSIFYYFITNYDFCSGDSVLFQYDVSDNTLCTVYLITDDDNGLCRTSFVFYPDESVRVLPLNEFEEQSCNRTSIVTAQIACEIYGDSQSFTLDSFEYACTTGTCSCNDNINNPSNSNNQSSNSGNTLVPMLILGVAAVALSLL
jgi:hypothetical protein